MWNLFHLVLCRECWESCWVYNQLGVEQHFLTNISTTVAATTGVNQISMYIISCYGMVRRVTNEYVPYCDIKHHA